MNQFERTNLKANVDFLLSLLEAKAKEKGRGNITLTVLYSAFDEK